MNKLLRLLLFLPLAFITLNAHAQPADNATETFGLIRQLQALQSRMNIQITGLDRVESEAEVTTHGNLEQQVQQLLASFNHIIIRGNKERIERIVIINKKQKSESDRIVLPTRRHGNHMLVSVIISGNGKIWQTVDMIIDTGADLVVLPDSMINELGLAENTFSLEKMQTANGIAEAKIGVLQELKIAGETIEHVKAAFIPDLLLGNNSLLGMNVLGRYQVHIDDTAQSVTLFKKY